MPDALTIWPITLEKLAMNEASNYVTRIEIVMGNSLRGYVPPVK